MVTSFLPGKKRPFLTVARLLLLALILIQLCGCDVYAGKRPFNYPNTVWTCKDPPIRLIVSDEGDMQFQIDEELDYPEDMEVHFDYGDRILFLCNHAAGFLFVGRCTFHVDRLVVNVTEDELFDGRYQNKRIVFRRSNVSFGEYLSEYFFKGVLLLLALAGIVKVLRKYRRPQDHEEPSPD